MSNLKNPVFSKLYRYYCTKLLKRIWMVAFWFLYVLGVLIFGGKYMTKVFEKDGWQIKLLIFTAISWAQLWFSLAIANPLVSYLVGRDLGWGNLRRRKFFGIPEIHKEEDIKVLLFTPAVDRQTVIFAKFAAAFTYFMAINFFLCSVLAVWFLAATGLGVVAAFSFLLLNGLFFGLVNAAFVIPFLFYQQEGGSFLVYFLCFAFTLFLILVGFFLRDFIIQYPLIFCSLSIPFLIFAGYFFYILYRKKFLTQDLG